MALDSMKEIFDRMEQEGKPFWEIVLETDMDERQVTRNQSMAKMLITWQAMADAADSYTGRRKSVSGLVGGDGMKMRQYCLRGEAMSGGYVSEVIAEALSMAESNACMCRIVAAPTAGACGVLPAVLLPMCKYEELSQHRILEALYVASGIGAVIAYKACIAGASGGTVYNVQSLNFRLTDGKAVSLTETANRNRLIFEIYNECLNRKIENLNPALFEDDGNLCDGWFLEENTLTLLFDYHSFLDDRLEVLTMQLRLD